MKVPNVVDIGAANNGNYLNLLCLLGKYDPLLERHLASKMKRGKYTSPTSQNELISAVAKTVQNTILDEDGHPQERFNSFIESTRGRAADLFEQLEALLEEHQLLMDFIRGQAYDGCSANSGRNTGLQARVRGKCHTALFCPSN
jgi:hypothetical protein